MKLDHQAENPSITIVKSDPVIKPNDDSGSIHIDIVKNCYKSIPNQYVTK